MFSSSIRGGVLLVAALASGTVVSAQTTERPPAPSQQASEPSLTLREGLDRARAHRPQTRLAGAGTARARGTARLTALIPNPQLNVQGDQRTPTHQLVVAQPLQWLPRRAADRRTGRALIDRATADSVQLLADLGREVRMAFFGSLAARERLVLSHEQALLADSLVRLADRRVSAGEISALERDQIAQEALRARLLAARAQETARTADVELARAVAWDSSGTPGARGALDEALDAVTDAAVNIRAEGAASVSTATMPLVQARVADSVAAASRLRALQWQQLPLPSLTLGTEWGSSTDTRLGSAASLPRTGIVGVSVSVPLWNQGREAVAEARGAATEASARAAEAHLLADAQRRAAEIRVAERAVRARLARDSMLVDARRVRAGAMRLYEAGRTGLLPVIDALRIERDVGQLLVQELLDFQAARADLAALLGVWP